jgi:hypothetical protein
MFCSLLLLPVLQEWLVQPPLRLHQPKLHALLLLLLVVVLQAWLALV